MGEFDQLSRPMSDTPHRQERLTVSSPLSVLTQVVRRFILYETLPDGSEASVEREVRARPLVHPSSSKHRLPSESSSSRSTDASEGERRTWVRSFARVCERGRLGEGRVGAVGAWKGVEDGHLGRTGVGGSCLVRGSRRGERRARGDRLSGDSKPGKEVREAEVLMTGGWEGRWSRGHSSARVERGERGVRQGRKEREANSALGQTLRSSHQDRRTLARIVYVSKGI